MILDCIWFISSKMFYNLKSGWKIILNIINVTMNDTSEQLILTSFNVI